MEEVRKKDREDNSCHVEDEDDDARVVVARRGNGIVGCKDLDVLQDVANANSRCQGSDCEREDSLEKDVCGKTHQSPAALAFTIDFDDGNKEVDTVKYQSLFQRFARHRRNVSTSKIEIKTSKSSADLSPNFVQKSKPVSNYSEGYFSSEDDTKRKADKLSQKLKELGLKTSPKGVSLRHPPMSRSLTERSTPHRRSYHEPSPPRPDLPNSSTMNDLSRLQSSLEDDRSNRVQYSPEKKYTKNIEYLEINHSYSSENLHHSQASSEKLKNTSYTPSSSNPPESPQKQRNIQTLCITYSGECSTGPNIDKFSVSNLDNDSDGTVSEAGTYTVHKDYTDEEKARMDIDKTFSVGILTEGEQHSSYVHHFQMNTSRDSNSWISDWATQVAEHNSLPPPIGGTTGRTPPMSPSKIPSPIYSRSKRLPRSRHEASDSSLDAEVHQRMASTMIDSGGESDEDTSNSYPTPPHSSQRTPTHSLVRRGSLSESLFKRVNTSDCRRSMRKCPDKKEEINVPKSPSHMLARLHLDRSNSLEHRGNHSDTAESNSSRRSSLRNYEENFKHTNSPILNRLRSTTPKLTNSPILGHKALASRPLAPNIERPKQLAKPGSQSKNIGYFTCVESSPYMLRKSLSTSNYREEMSKDKLSNLHGSPMLSRSTSIQRSASNTSIRTTKTKSMLTRRSSFNDNSNDRLLKTKLAHSDSSSETGEAATPVPPISSGIKLNRTFSMRRARLSCESESTPNTTPEERRRRAQSEIKSAPTSGRQAHHRGRTSSVGASNKEVFKKPEPPKPRGPSLSRNEGGRYSMRAQKTSPSTRPNQKASKEGKNSGRSNSTLTSKEVEFQNWKRRKNYDPMKAAAEGKRKLDVNKKHHSTEDGNSRDSSVLRSASFHGTGGALSLADDWSDNEVNFGGDVQPPPCSPLGSDSDLDTSSYLQTTHNVMSAMSARINVYQGSAVDSGGESDEDTSHSLRQGRVGRETSDTESSEEQGNSGNRHLGFNRGFVGRRSREPEAKAPQAKAKVVNSARSKSEGTSIARTDSGRFSVRAAKGSAVKVKPKEVKKKESLVKEQEMQNWKRRKSYDPMKAAAEGKRKAGMVKRSLNSESSSVLRSQSFHGPVTLGLSEWSDEDISASADEAPIY
ncbi:serine/arginine repetitive matrix protein 2 isoform X1 [Diachasma alloeum]|uniref:serine/arginine repetitive matrix protein 2 isoform X1 n=1 Tax=Diachasma alloeum TaxID=454923 RepID=UPI0007381CF0|nr:serine/arginine repetitive matrix protein 2 isoform X1 [Diachasma alloeum]